MYSTTKNPLLRRISDGNNSSRFTLPPLNTTTTHALPLLPPSQKSTFSYSYPNNIMEERGGGNIQHEEYYYSVYNKHYEIWSEDESMLPIVENGKMKKKKEMNDRIKEIDREFLDNRKVLYEEKMKQLQDELIAVEKGQHGLFDSIIADLEEKRREIIHNAKLMMIYQISIVDKQCNLTSKKLNEESLAEQKEIQNTLFSIIKEKRRKLKQDKDSEGDLLLKSNNDNQHHQTRNRKRLSRKRGGELEVISSMPPQLPLSLKKKIEKQKENPSHLIGLLSHRIEEEIDADFYEMTTRPE